MGRGHGQVVMSKDHLRFAQVTDEALHVNVQDGSVNILDGSVIAETEMGRKLREGKLFWISSRSGVGSGNSLSFLVETGNVCTYAKFFGNCQFITQWNFFENTTTSGNISLVPHAKNRCDSEAPLLRNTAEATVTDVGDILAHDFQNFSMGGGGPGHLFGEEPWVLAPNTIYMVRGNNAAGATNQILVGVEFFEEPI